MIIKDGVNFADISRQLAMAKGKTSVSTLSNIRKDRNITRATKVRDMKALVFPIVLYGHDGCETLAVGMADRRAISAFEMLC